MLKRHAIQVLHGAGHPVPEIAALTGVPERSVERIIKEPPVDQTDDATARKTRRIGRPSKVEPFREAVAKLLKKEPGCRSNEVLRRMRIKGYDGGKSAMYSLIASVRPPREKMVNRFEGLPGEFSQHDFGQVDVRYANDVVERVHFFATRMKYSRFSLVSIVPDQRAETLVRAVVDHFTEIRGVPLLAVFDRPKTVAVKWRKDGTITQFNRTFAEAMMELRVSPEVCWPYQPQQKGSVEHLVGWVKNSFFKSRVFLDREDLESQLKLWLKHVNEARPNRATGVIPMVRLEEERERLRPVLVRAEEFAIRQPARVSPMATVTFEGHRYELPPGAAGLSATLHVFRDRVRIVAGRHRVEYPRGTRPGTTTSQEVRAERLAGVSGNRGRHYVQREQLLELGADAAAFITEAVHARSHHGWYDDIRKLHELLQLHGDAAMKLALRLAVEQERFTVDAVAAALLSHLQLELGVTQ